MSRSWFATNNTATLDDLPDLEVFGIALGKRTSKTVSVSRDLPTGRLLATIGTVRVFRDGRVKITPRQDCPDEGVTVLVRTALDCVERDLHRRDRREYYRATAKVVGHWSGLISVRVPEGESVFEAHAEVMRPAAAPGGRARSTEPVYPISLPTPAREVH